MKPDVLVLQEIRPDQMKQLEAAYTLHRYDQVGDPDALLAEVGDKIEAVVTSGGSGITRAQIERMPNLKIASLSSVGYDTVDLAACNDHGVTVTNTPDVLNDDVADTAIMLLLAVQRGLVKGDAYARSGEWAKSGPMPLLRSTRGKKLGVVGLGRIGKAIAERATPFGLNIVYHGRNKQDAVDYPYYADLKEMAQDVDIMIVITAGGEGTRGLISKDVIEALGPDGALINVSRGTVVDEPAMIEALQSGKLGAAGLDVFLNEPDIDPAFAALENVTLYPHHASGTIETRAAMSQLVVDNLAAHFAGKPLLTPVN
ncbi:2-hydroxyacid dehydrogenase [Qingshengfaniella alkalisoli]|uniref:2-hydroxyacid dehydrogenase n=1 Tax=Qingshengfaniella alkalisoli TaxID=2599296 RepID=A0A5B8J0V6_9RHOB|nr:2-hydroxyacid dehydrogenase [Qingshengfaniella alkalisoli]QDY71524.1 2-hydroxyacid dehydrogenase [Qingshengfaniella alkalisoli]